MAQTPNRIKPKNKVLLRCIGLMVVVRVWNYSLEMVSQIFASDLSKKSLGSRVSTTFIDEMEAWYVPCCMARLMMQGGGIDDRPPEDFGSVLGQRHRG